MLHRPGGIARARNSSASQVGNPDAFGSNALCTDGALAIRQRMRAPLRLAWPPSRIMKAATPDRSDATASRRVAVKSSTLGSPQISPMTAESAAHLKPSSMDHSASRASRASTWMRLRTAMPGGWIRPFSRIAMRSWTHSSGFAGSSCARRKPAHPPSPGCAAKISERVGCCGAGSFQVPPCVEAVGRGTSDAGGGLMGWAPRPRHHSLFGEWFPSPAGAGEE